MPQPEVLVNGPFLVDGHVHIYPGYEPAVFLARALANFARGAVAAGVSPDTPGVLLLTETTEHNYVRRWSTPPGPGVDGWQVAPAGDDRSLLLLRAGRVRLVMVAGRQLVTREGLEVLALGCSAAPATSMDLPDALGAVRDAGAIPVLPWGFGKWWGRRGRLVRQALEAPTRPLFLGDSGVRLRGSPPPGEFGLGRERGIFTLAGSDPLPLRHQQGRAGSYGFVLEGSLDLGAPANSIHTLLHGLQAQPRTFGRRVNPLAFVRSQLAMQLATRSRRLGSRLVMGTP